MPLIEPGFASAFRAIIRPAVSRVREVPLKASMLCMQGRGPLAVFLPSRGREGASLVRIYSVAGALRAHGWRCLVLPWRLNLRQRQRFIAASQPDVVVMQGVRHVLNRPVFYSGVPIVMDLDDADFHLPHLSAPLRRAMPDLGGVIVGSRYVAEWCRNAGAREVHVVWTGMAVSSGPRPPQRARPPVVAWAQTRPMTYEHEAEMVREVVAGLSRLRPDVRLRLYDRQPGDDDQFANWFRSAGITVEWHKKAQFSDYLRSFDDVSIGLAPLSDETPFSRGKSFGKVLAYLDRHVPVIGSDAGEHAAFFTPATGLVTNETGLWVEAAARLLGDPDARQQQAEAAFTDFRRRLSLERTAEEVDEVLRKIKNIT